MVLDKPHMYIYFHSEFHLHFWPSGLNDDWLTHFVALLNKSESLPSR